MQTHRLICVFFGRTCPQVPFLMLRLKCIFDLFSGSLLRNAKEIHKGKSVKVFEKPGGAKQAEMDAKSLTSAGAVAEEVG